MQQKSKNDFSAFRLRKDSVKYLQNLKRAFELSYGREFSNDEFIQQITSLVKTGDVPTWTIFCKMQDAQREIEEYAVSSRNCYIEVSNSL